MVLGEQRFLKSCIFESFLKEGRGLPQPWQSLGGGCTTGGTGYEISLDSCACTRCQMTLTCRTQQTTGSVGQDPAGNLTVERLELNVGSSRCSSISSVATWDHSGRLATFFSSWARVRTRSPLVPLRGQTEGARN